LYLFALSQGEEIRQEDDSKLAERLIENYSVFQKFENKNGLDFGVNGDVVERWGNAAFLTGTTGSVGAHTLHQLLHDPYVSKIYCPVRGKNPLQRVMSSLSQRRLSVPEQHQDKIVAFESDLNHPTFNLSPSAFALLKRELALIIHTAWPVNFNLPLKSFEPHILGLHNLLSLSMNVKRPSPARFYFASSVSVALNLTAGSHIPEALQNDFGAVSATGYARSKFVGEHIVARATEMGARASVLRIGQVVGDTKWGLWNEGEFLPMVIRSSLVLGVLPLLEERCSWLPVDTLAAAILDLTKLKVDASPSSSTPSPPQLVYNLLNPHTFTWSSLLHSLRTHLQFQIVPFAHWLALLNQSATKGEEEDNPAVKLLEYFEMNYREGIGGGGCIFETENAERDSRLGDAPRVLEEGLVGKFVGRWMESWGCRKMGGGVLGGEKEVDGRPVGGKRVNGDGGGGKGEVDGGMSNGY
ncbi:MAG: hypothetical protein Q9192_001881, partial [Flavoplaca navasiana]